MPATSRAILLRIGLIVALAPAAFSVVPALAAPTPGEEDLGDYEVTPEGMLGVARGGWLRID